MKDDLESRWHELGEFIREQRSIGQLSLRKLSEMAGVSNPYLSQIERGLRRPSAEILQQIARALEISSETLYVRAGILDEPNGDIDVISEIRRDPRLSEEHKKTLVRIYQSFVREFEAERGPFEHPGGGFARSGAETADTGSAGDDRGMADHDHAHSKI